MKKNNLLVGILYILCGAIFLIIALLFDIRLNSLLFGFSGAFIGPGIIMISKYFYWTAPKNRNRYAERLENENIELHDERKEKLRDKSGRYAYVLGLAITGFSIVLFSILGKLEVITNSKLIILYLGGYFVFQYIAGVIIFRHLNNKY
ncbi:hypothetical protein Psfp_01525 [Pelotomaculum sp. FP]|uniref:hypothetical protein n=1 Tax=Pelotomaculum sp. FP TaxID=261474 RepID=UPI001064646C|nr:hypothetical protein [Pelotomaculum sp. FP]TEB16298.1 hypothetical protein Psfp_01525 [Pelotomaculum sp. FP]